MRSMQNGHACSSPSQLCTGFVSCVLFVSVARPRRRRIVTVAKGSIWSLFHFKGFFLQPGEASSGFLYFWSPVEPRTEDEVP